ncbi:MAG: uroporphyrinogen decarboxylase [Deltaproteobacteria bacterium]|nr:MAG: uroporphyrinogen decarboxylase [Deltaproteobacteria bacterium]
MTSMTDLPLFLQAATGIDTRTAPVWFMRQAGRHLPEYRALKEKYAFWELCRNPELATEVTMQPVRRYGMDAAILFSDIMTPLPPMGIGVEFRPGPVIDEPIRSAAQVSALRVPDEDEIAPFVADTLRLLEQASPVPPIGFGGAPLTLATYAIEGSGSKEYPALRAFLRTHPAVAHALLEKLTETSIRYLRMQVRSGARAVQLFDSWAGLHDARTYAEFALPYNRRILEALGETGVPRIFLAVGAPHLLDQVATLPAEVFSIDWREPLDAIRPRLPAGCTLQGNLDPAALLAPPDAIRSAVTAVLDAGRGGPHIFNLGHGIFKNTPPENVVIALEALRAYDRHAG